MAIKEKQKLWFLGAAAAAILAFAGISLSKISSFVSQFSFTPTVTSFKIVDSKIWNLPPVLGNAQIGVDIRIDNPLNSAHAITDFSIRIFDITKGSTQIGNSLPIAEKITIPASSSATVKNVQILIPVQSLFGQLSADSIKNMISKGQVRLNREYKLSVHLRLDGIAGNTETKITI